MLSKVKADPIVIAQENSQRISTKRSRWHGLFQDIGVEHGFQPLHVEGDIPEEINGVLYQNGPGVFSSQGQPYAHIFDGDGLVRAIKIQGGKAEGAAKLVQSKGLLEERKAGKLLYSGVGTEAKNWQSTKARVAGLIKNKPAVKNVANTSVLFWQERLFALVEGASLPTELNPDTLDTIGETSFDNVIRDAFTAHPHWVSERNAGFSFGIRTGRENLLDIHEFPKSGPCKLLTTIKLDRRPIAYVHDFIATPNYIVFFIPPLHLENKKIPNMLLGSAIYPLIEWQEHLGTEVIIVPIERPSEVIRFKTDPFFPVHFANAYEENDEIIVDYTHSDSTLPYDLIGKSHLGLPTKYFLNLVEKQKDNTKNSILRRAHINLKRKDIRYNIIVDSFCEFPKINPSLQGSKHQYVYFTKKLDESEVETIESPFFDQIVKLDIASGEINTLDLGEEQFPLEPIFIRKSNAKKEDEGYLLSMIYDGNKHQSYLVIIDAQRIEEGPVAKLHFGQALPISFHGVWRSL